MCYDAYVRTFNTDDLWAEIAGSDNCVPRGAGAWVDAIEGPLYVISYHITDKCVELCHIISCHIVSIHISSLRQYLSYMNTL